MFRVPAPLLRVAVGEVADILLTGQRVEPRRAREAGFNFRFTDIDSALRDIVSKPSSSTSSSSKPPGSEDHSRPANAGA